jgi:hypothetical protein
MWGVVGMQLHPPLLGTSDIRWVQRMGRQSQIAEIAPSNDDHPSRIPIEKCPILLQTLMSKK